MISNRKNPFSATVQVNADKKSLEFIYPNAKQSQEQGQKQTQQNSLVTSDGVTIPKSISGIELSRQQQQDLVNDKTIFVAGLKDKRGVEYDAYIQVNHDKKKLGFYSDNPSFDRSAVKEITPASKNRTQVAVNSEGKTNEATKKVKEPLKRVRTSPLKSKRPSRIKRRSRSKRTNPNRAGDAKDDSGINPYPGCRFRPIFFACYKTDWKAIDEQNRQYYIDGYHIYYDRKILRQKEVEQLKSKLE